MASQPADTQGLQQKSKRPSGKWVLKGATVQYVFISDK